MAAYLRFFVFFSLSRHLVRNLIVFSDVFYETRMQTICKVFFVIRNKNIPQESKITSNILESCPDISTAGIRFVTFITETGKTAATRTSGD